VSDRTADRVRLARRLTSSSVGRRARRALDGHDAAEALVRRVLLGSTSVAPRRRRSRYDPDGRTENQVVNDLALRLLRDGRVVEAELVLDHFTTVVPGAHRSRFLRGVAALHLGDLDVARRLIDEAYARSPGLRDELWTLPWYGRAVGRAARADPGWAWPAYLVAKCTQAIPVVTPAAIGRLLDGMAPAEVAVVGGDVTGDPVADLPTSVAELIPARARITTLPASNIARHDPDDVARLAEVDALVVDAGPATADRVRTAAAAWPDGRAPRVVLAPLATVGVAARLAAVRELRGRDMVVHLDRDRLVAVSGHDVRNRRIHGWTVGDADFDPGLVDDRVTRPEPDLASVVREVLEHHQVRFAITPEPTGRRTRFSLRSADKAYVVSRLLEVDLGTRRLHVPRLREAGDPEQLTTLHLVDDGRRYLADEVELDPWTRDDDYVSTRSENRLVSAVPVADIERTVHGFDPPFLLADRHKPVRLGERLGIASTVLDTCPFPVDVVYTWVDDRDPAWQERRRDALTAISGGEPAHDTTTARYRNRDELRYSMRSVAAFLPHVRHLYLLTDRQVPSWLDTDHPKITVVDHADVFERPDWLPTFNSNAIESRLHRIDGLAEHALYFNDDVVLTGPCTPETFFVPNGLSRVFLEPRRTQYGSASPRFHNSKNAVLNSIAVFRERFGSSFHQFHQHTPFPFRRSLFEAMAAELRDPIDATASHRFRSADDVAPISALYPWFAVAGGHAVPGSIRVDYVNLGRDDVLDRLAGTELQTRPSVLCLNDAPNEVVDADALDRAVTATLERLFPVPAPWESDPALPGHRLASRDGSGG
jgi:hypothetical protein